MTTPERLALEACERPCPSTTPHRPPRRSTRPRCTVAALRSLMPAAGSGTNRLARRRDRLRADARRDRRGVVQNECLHPPRGRARLAAMATPEQLALERCESTPRAIRRPRQRPRPRRDAPSASSGAIGPPKPVKKRLCPDGTRENRRTKCEHGHETPKRPPQKFHVFELFSNYHTLAVGHWIILPLGFVETARVRRRC